MQLLWLLPFVLLAIGASLATSIARSRGHTGSKIIVGLIWIIPFVLQMVAVRLLRGGNELAVTKFDWLLMDSFGIRLNTAQYVDDVLCRVAGVTIGLILINVFIVKQPLWPARSSSRSSSSAR